jgi:CBS domain-containing protein
MNVGDMMTREVQTCRLDDPLNRVAQIMWEYDCGCVPVVDWEGRVVAMITDRDVCMAAYTQGRTLASMVVSTAASQGLLAVRESDTVEAAEAVMQQHQVRRVPVVDAEGRAVGILSMSDLARHAHSKGHLRHDSLSPEKIVRTFAAVCQPTPSNGEGGSDFLSTHAS